MSPDPNLELTAVTLCNALCTGTVTYAGVDISGFVGTCKLFLSQDKTAGTLMASSILDSADNTTFAAVVAPTIINAASSVSREITLDTKTLRRYIQFRHVTNGSTTYQVGAFVIGQQQVQ